MKILILHNRYRFAGGEDTSVSLEADLLRTYGHQVIEFVVDNRDLENAPWMAKVRTGWESNWSRQRHEEIRRLCRVNRPDIAHIHNFWPQLTPSVYSACRSEGAAVVQTIRNFRLMCLNGTFYRKGKQCTLCCGRSPWPGVLFRCYRDSWIASLAAARMIMDNRRRKTWDIDIDQWIALSEHSRAQFIDSGVPGEKILVKPNFCPDPGFVSAPPDGRHVILYIGRLSPEKGILVLLKAWKKLEDESATFNGELRIVGDGPSREIVERACTALRSARFIGWQCPKDVLKTIQQSHAVVVPSLVPETFGRSVIEAWSCARPVLAASIGALSELVHDDVDGRLHTPADVPMLARQIRELMEDAATGLRLGRAGHERWKKTYSPDINYALLMRAYEQARENFARTFH